MTNFVITSLHALTNAMDAVTVRCDAFVAARTTARSASPALHTPAPTADEDAMAEVATDENGSAAREDGANDEANASEDAAEVSAAAEDTDEDAPEEDAVAEDAAKEDAAAD
jgi:hypothetical protein